MIKCLQLNVNRSRAAFELLEQTFREQGTDIALIAEPNQKLARSRGWLVDRRGDTAIKVINSGLKISEHGEGEGYSWVMTEKGLVFVACYFSPNRETEEFQSYLQSIGALIGSLRTNECLVAGDFNAKSYAWDDNRENPRGGDVK